MDENPWGYKVTVVAYVKGPIELATEVAEAMEAHASGDAATFVGTMIDEVNEAPSESGRV